MAPTSASIEDPLERADALLDRFKLTDRADQMVRGFSGGMMQRLSIARAMMHDPAGLFLDEPSAGLDPQTRLLLWEIIREYNQTWQYHPADDALHGRSRFALPSMAIIDHGRIIAVGTPGELSIRSRRLSAAPAFRDVTRPSCWSARNRSPACAEVRTCDEIGAPIFMPTAAAR